MLVAPLDKKHYEQDCPVSKDVLLAWIYFRLKDA